MNYEIAEDEVILYEGRAGLNNCCGSDFVLTNKKIIFTITKGHFKKKTTEVITYALEDIKIYNDVIQSKQKSNEIQIQTKNENITINLSGVLEAKKVNSLIIDAITGTTVVQRGSKKVKDALNLVDETLGLDTKKVVQGVVENGITGTLLRGIHRKKK